VVALVRPVKWCSVPLSEVRERKIRLEAGVYDSATRRAKDSVLSCPWGWTSLGGARGLVDAWVGSRFKRIWVYQGGIPIYQPSAITELLPEPDGFLSGKTRADLQALRVHAPQILLTCSGTVGKVALVSRTLSGHVFSHDLLRLTCRNPADTGYVYAFLKSRAGQLLLGSNQYGAVITHIEPEHLSGIPVPNAPEEVKRRIHEAVARSFELRDESNDLLVQARTLLADALALPPLADFAKIHTPSSGKPKTFSVRLKELEGRLDGSYHLPVGRSIEAHLHEHAAEVTTVGDSRVSRKIILPGRFKRVYVDEDDGVPFLSPRSIGELNPTDKKWISLKQHANKINRELALKAGMIIVTCSGTIGNVALVSTPWEGWVMTHDLVRIIPTDSMQGFLFVWLSIPHTQFLLKAKAYGSVVQHIDREHVAKLPVPLLADAAVQAKINALALAASSKRSEAYDLEQTALRIMENEVLSAGTTL
jgi:type I restriction enzyme S subunit